MLLGRGVVTLINSASKLQTLQIRWLDSSLKDGMEYFEPYGFTSAAGIGGEALAVFFDGDRSQGVVICVAQRQYRLRGLKSGEVALYDARGQKIVLSHTGIVLTSPQSVRIEAPCLACTGDIIDHCDDTGKTMAAMRQRYNEHTHPATHTPTKETI
jgi:phage baseplate assembly protein V